MPTVTNISSEPILLPFWGGQYIEPGQSIKTSEYPEHLPPGLTLSDHLPSPVASLHSGPPPATLSTLSQWKDLIISNGSGADIICIFNGDNSHPLVVPSNGSISISMHHDIWDLSVSGSGTGNVYIYVSNGG